MILLSLRNDTHLHFHIMYPRAVISCLQGSVRLYWRCERWMVMRHAIEMHKMLKMRYFCIRLQNLHITIRFLAQFCWGGEKSDVIEEFFGCELRSAGFGCSGIKSVTGERITLCIRRPPVTTYDQRIPSQCVIFICISKAVWISCSVKPAHSIRQWHLKLRYRTFF